MAAGHVADVTAAASVLRRVSLGCSTSELVEQPKVARSMWSRMHEYYVLLWEGPPLGARECGAFGG